MLFIFRDTKQLKGKLPEKHKSKIPDTPSSGKYQKKEGSALIIIE
jgi:hypothetical protein